MYTYWDLGSSFRAKVSRYSTVFPKTFHTDEISRESWAVHTVVQHNILYYSTGVSEGKDNSTNTMALQYLLIGNDHIYLFTWVEVGKEGHVVNAVDGSARVDSKRVRSTLTLMVMDRHACRVTGFTCRAACGNKCTEH